jgi:glycosidase
MIDDMQGLAVKPVSSIRSGFIYNITINKTEQKEQQGYSIDLLATNDIGSTYKVTIKIPMSVGWIEDVYMDTLSNYGSKSFKLNFKENKDGLSIFEADIFLMTSALYKYDFTFTANGNRLYMDSNMRISNYSNYENKGQLSVNFKTPDWAKGATMYHIFVDRFSRGQLEKMPEMDGREIKNWNDEVKVPGEHDVWNNDYYGGDLQGIINHLGYFQSLGVDVLYLSPIVYAQSVDRYATSDYEQIDPYVGTKEDLKNLCNEAHKRGIRIVLDAVFNHTGDNSKYFNRQGKFDTTGAIQDPNSYYGSFYRKNDKGEYDCWYGFNHLPRCNGESYNWQQYIYGEGGIIDQWFDLGIDGLRLDVADELTDSFIENIRKAVHRNKEDGLIIGEVWKYAMTEPRSYMASGKGMDSQMDYPLCDALMRYFRFADTYKAKGVIQNILNEYPKEIRNVLMNFTSTHDISRPINIFGSDKFVYDRPYIWDTIKDGEKQLPAHVFNDYKMTMEEYRKGKELFEAYSFCLNFMPGILSIFYGDEIGMTGYGNIINRSPFDLTKADRELLEFFRILGQARKRETFLKEADLKMLDINDKYIMFERNSNNGDALIAVNRTDESIPYNIPSSYEKYDNAYTMKLSNRKTLNPYSGVAFIKK